VMVSTPAFFTHAYSWIARIGSFLFLVVQVMLLVDFACDLGEFWQARAEERDKALDAAGYVPGLLQNCWFVLLSTSVYYECVSLKLVRPTFLLVQEGDLLVDVVNGVVWLCRWRWLHVCHVQPL
jgi:Serine incorporator (Serinc)